MLAAVAFGQKPIEGIEINPIIVKAVHDDFRDFVGGIYERPDVQIHIDEGRSFLARS
ncbi:MAG: hypothetical protein HY801_02415 [Candidatus Lindowbacteria bacterium]|nr:hypothetical protein [Candidatus Lindowbacteria bacterium]